MIEDNIRLVKAFSRYHHVSEESISRGLAEADQDIGGLKVWRLSSRGKRFFFINGFSANEPESTEMILRKIQGGIPEKGRVHGYLTLRSDRPDRSQQWLDFLEKREDFCSTLLVAGRHAPLFCRKTGAKKCNYRRPEKIIDTVGGEVFDNDIVLGMGNMMGRGEKVVTYLNRSAQAYAL